MSLLKQSQNGKITPKNLTLAGVAAMGLLLAFTVQIFPSGVAAQQNDKPVAALSPYIDVHSHLDPADPEGSVKAALDVMAMAHMKKVVFMPSPFGPDDKVAFEAEKFMDTVKKHSDKIAFLGGGGTLNVMIQAEAGKAVSPETLKKFRAQAEKLLSEGAVGFGGISAEHVPSASSPSYSAAPPRRPAVPDPRRYRRRA